MAVHLLGIRHHGPGSARHVREHLDMLKPDIILIEGPAEAEQILSWAGHKDMKPPVAILTYVPEQLNRSVFYPLAEFSPEWQAIQYALENKVTLRFIDLPATYMLAFSEQEKTVTETAEEMSTEPEYSDSRDPFTDLAKISGYSDGEKWWENHFEHRQDSSQIFEAVNEAVTALREQVNEHEKPLEKCREAWMRKCIKQAEKDMFSDIAVVCGAWHVAALQNMPKQKDDNELLKGMPKIKVESTWVPWSYSRLSFASGYGAGIQSPGWYHHIWKNRQDTGMLWLTKVARTFRKQKMDISSAHVIEAVRLSETLAYMRGYALPGLDELNEASNSIMCMGDSIMMGLIHKELIVSPRIGSVPLDSPKPPLQVDITKQQKLLRLPLTEIDKELLLDLREERDLAKSVFLHRLSVLGITWALKKFISGKGTFKEAWILKWDAAIAIDIIDKGIWGQTVEEAANNFVMSRASSEHSISAITVLLEDSLLSDLPIATSVLLNRVNNLAAASSDVMQLMEALPNLVSSLRYGNVRKTDQELLGKIVDGMVSRIFVGLPAACLSLDEEAAQVMVELLLKLNDAISLLQNTEQIRDWQSVLLSICGTQGSSSLIAGYTARLVYDYHILDEDKIANIFSRALSPGVEYAKAAFWLEGFLKGSGTILLIDEALWGMVNNWVDSLYDEQFIQVLPLMRRTFAQFALPERRKLGEKARQKGAGTNGVAVVVSETDHISGMRAIPAVMSLLGIETE